MFHAPDDGGGQPAAGFRLALDGQAESQDLAHAATVDLDEADVSFGDPGMVVPVDDGRLQQVWFAEGTTTTSCGTSSWSVPASAVVFSWPDLDVPDPHRGRSKSVLCLEAGSILFPTHIGNLPSVRSGGPSNVLATSMWNSLGTFGSATRVANPSWGKGRGRVRAGRPQPLLGGLCPRVHPDELKRWPQAVREDLLGPTANCT